MFIPNNKLLFWVVYNKRYSQPLISFYQIKKLSIITKFVVLQTLGIFLFLSHLSIHKKREYHLPKLTTEVERREWDSNPIALLRGLYQKIRFQHIYPKLILIKVKIYSKFFHRYL